VRGSRPSSRIVCRSRRIALAGPREIDVPGEKAEAGHERIASHRAELTLDVVEGRRRIRGKSQRGIGGRARRSGEKSDRGTARLL
jgi:hypothetical protein